MSLPRQLQGANHLFNFLSLLSSSQNACQCCQKSLRHISFRYSLAHRQPLILRCYSSTPPERTMGRAVRALGLSKVDREDIRTMLPMNRPKRQRQLGDVLDALRKRGYVPAHERVDEVLDMSQSHYQRGDEFDNITLGLLLKTAKTVEGIRNTYKIPHLLYGQNPARNKMGQMPVPFPSSRLFLFPDGTNWSILSAQFPLSEPPKPWHPIVMQGRQQDYTQEEVARRLEWSRVRNAKCMRNGYHWASPDPDKWPKLDKLPVPPPPVIRACNTCGKPRYLMRFWNFYYQKWQHVSSPHRPIDCGGHARGSVGRLMFAPPKAKIGGTRATQIEDKEWIEEETAVKLLFRAGFLNLPKINIEQGKIFTEASVNRGEAWEWIRQKDIVQYARRGGRENGLVDLSNVGKLDELEAARKQQEKEFSIKHAKMLAKARFILEEYPLPGKESNLPDDNVDIPEGYLYPANHPVTMAWIEYEKERVKSLTVKRQQSRQEKLKLQHDLSELKEERKQLMDEINKTKAEITLLMRGGGEVWIDPVADIIRRKQQFGTDVAHESAPSNFRPYDVEKYPVRESERERLRKSEFEAQQAATEGLMPQESSNVGNGSSESEFEIDIEGELAAWGAKQADEVQGNKPVVEEEDEQEEEEHENEEDIKRATPTFSSSDYTKNKANERAPNKAKDVTFRLSPRKIEDNDDSSSWAFGNDAKGFDDDEILAEDIDVDKLRASFPTPITTSLNSSRKPDTGVFNPDEEQNDESTGQSSKITFGRTPLRDLNKQPRFRTFQRIPDKGDRERRRKS